MNDKYSSQKNEQMVAHNNATNEVLDYDSSFDFSTTVINQTFRKAFLTGEYPFTVEKVERGITAKGNKQYDITIHVATENGVVEHHIHLPLTQAGKWKIEKFLLCIGAITPNFKGIPPWNTLVGKVGRAAFEPKTFTGNDGKEHQYNEIQEFLMPAMVQYDADDDLEF